MNLLPKDDTELTPPVLSKSVKVNKKNKTQLASFDISSTDLDNTPDTFSKKKEKTPNHKREWDKRSKLFFSLLSVSLFLFIFISVFVIGFLIQLRNAEINYANKYRDIYISSVPRDANVYIDNEIKGITPLVLHNVKIDGDRELKLRKDGFEPYTILINADNVQETYNITLDSVGLNTSQVNISRLGISFSIPDVYKPNNSPFVATCINIKNSLTDASQCINDNQTIDYIKYRSNLSISPDTYFEIDPYTLTDICTTGTQSDCTNGFALNSSQKVKKTTVLGQEVDIMRAPTGELYVAPAVKVSGLDFSAIIIKSNKISVDIFENILSSIDKY